MTCLPALKVQITVEGLTLSPLISQKDADDLAEVLPDLTQLHQVALEIQAPLSDTLNTMDPSGVYTALAQLPLRNLKLSGAKLTSSDIEKLAPLLQQLQSLTLERAHINAEGITTLAKVFENYHTQNKIPGITKLKLDSTCSNLEISPQNLIRILKNLPNLHELILNGLFFKKEDMKAIIDSLPALKNLQKLSLPRIEETYDQQETDAAAEHNIEEEINYSLAETLQQLPQLRVLNLQHLLHNTHVSAVISTLPHLKKLQSLDLGRGRNAPFEEVVVELAKAIKGMPELKKLNLHGNWMSSNAVEVVIPRNGKPQQLKVLNLSYDNLNTSGVTAPYNGLPKPSQVTKIKIAQIPLVAENRRIFFPIGKNSKTYRSYICSYS